MQIKPLKKYLFLICCFPLTLFAQNFAVKFSVDMHQQIISPSGVHVAGNFQNEAGFNSDWDPAATLLTDANADSIYEVILNFPAGYYEYKFVNGNTWAGAENPPLYCSVGSTFNRYQTITAATNLPAVAFNKCNLPSTNYATYWWNDAVFYEIFVRSFYDSNNDGIGDFQGIIQKLNYLNDGNPNTNSDLGITALWLMPMMASPSYHGYDVTDYYATEPDYGTMADFEALIDSAHAHGIKIIIDYVMNHTSNQHPWFTQSANNVNNYRNWYVWSPTNPAFLGPWGQTVWHNYNNSYYYGLFYNGMPDLNYDNAAVKTEMFKVSDFWLNKGVDGFRLDAIKYLDEDGAVLENTPGNFMLLQDFNASYKKTNPNAFAIGEVWSATPSIVPYVENNRLDACFEFGLAGAILTSVNNKNSEAIKNQIKVVAQAYPSLQYGTFLTNHDQDRVYTQLGNDTSKMKLAAAQYLTLPGVPFIYYGEEIGMIGSGADENKRKPMQWTAGTNAGFSTHLPWQTLGTNYTTNNVQTLSANKNSIWNYYQKLIRARNENEALRKGYVLLLANQKNTNMAFVRIYNQTAILSVSNFSNSNTTDSLSLGISTLNAGNYQASNLLTGENLGVLTINNVGGFANFTIQANTLKASSNVLIKLTNTNTGIMLDKAKLFTMHPNPAQTQIQFDLNITDDDVDLVIYDSNGMQMHAQKINHANHSINIEKLAKGVYFVKISNKKFTQTERLLKQ